MLGLLLKRRWLSLRNTFAAFSAWDWTRNGAFTAAGVGLLFGLHYGFYRLLAYLATVPMIGDLLLWKLTDIFLLTTFAMVVISSLLTSLTTLYYSYDLKFLMKAPLDARTVFVDKSLESVFFASWMIGLVLVPYAAAIVRTHHFPAAFLPAFALLLVPFLLLAAAFGIAFTMGLLYLFPSSRTRDVIWMASSLSLTFLYGAIRYAQPERLVRPDALRVVADYLNFLQAPTARYLPSWWLAKALMACAAGRAAVFWRYAGLLVGATAAVYAVLIWAAGPLYFAGYSGAQEGGLRRRTLSIAPLAESRWLGGRELGALFWKERVAFFRDVKHWSQLLLVLGLIFVYLFSIGRLPLDSPDLRSLVSFLNIGTAGFVLAALGLRFTFPSISLEGRSWWVLGCAPVDAGHLMRQKALFSAVPMLLLAAILGGVTNRILDADRFTSWVSLGALLVIALALCAMGVGFGALFPMFHVENIHQIESSVGGFVYMACALFYIASTIMILAWPMNMHFARRFGRPQAWRPGFVLACFAAWALLTLIVSAAPWLAGRRTLERLEA